MSTPPIIIVGDCWTDADESAGRSFSGGPGHVLRGLLAQAGIEQQAVKTTSVLPLSPPGVKMNSLLTRSKLEAASGLPPVERGYWFPASFVPHLTRLHHLISTHRPNIVVAMGNLALWALTRQTGIAKWRGSPMLSHSGEYKVIATWSPTAIIRQWNLRPIAFMDLCKAKKESEDPRLIRPRRILHLAPTLADIADFYEKHIVPAPFIAVDVETKADSITEVGIATSRSTALVIPFWSRDRHNYWPTLEAEREAWEWVRRILAEKPTIGQNFQYDMQYFLRTMGIPCPRFIGDTMLLHHSLQPEMKKGLGFLGSIYTSEPSWKFMRTDHSTMKREDE